MSLVATEQQMADPADDCGCKLSWSMRRLPLARKTRSRRQRASTMETITQKRGSAIMAGAGIGMKRGRPVSCPT